MTIGDVFSSAVIFWLVVAVVLAILEILIPLFGFILVAAAALIPAAVAWQNGSVVVQIGSFAVAVLFSIGFLRPRIISRMYSAEKVLSRTEKLFGKEGIVTQDIDPLKGQGRVNIHGEDWGATSQAEISKGKTVVVQGAEGIILKVKEVKET